MWYYHRNWPNFVASPPIFVFDGAMYNRKLDLTSILARKSIMLLGPRQTGKSTLLATLLPKAFTFDLLMCFYFDFLRSSVPEISASPRFWPVWSSCLAAGLFFTTPLFREFIFPLFDILELAFEKAT